MLSHRKNSHASRSSSAPVAAKRGAVNSSTGLKFSLYMYVFLSLGRKPIFLVHLRQPNVIKNIIIAGNTIITILNAAIVINTYLVVDSGIQYIHLTFFNL
jgi:hypothetical protein